jgi:hypothetical protein
LTRAYAALGLEPASMFSLIHQRSIAPSREPVEVRPPGHSVTGEKIPAPPAAGTDGTISLDPAVVAATLAASAASTALLGKIFVDDDVVPAPVQPAPSPDILGTGYATLLERLATHATLTHAAFVSLATELGLLPNRAIEVLNEAALDRWGDPVLEGDEVLEVNHDALKELLG